MKTSQEISVRFLSYLKNVLDYFNFKELSKEDRNDKIASIIMGGIIIPPFVLCFLLTIIGVGVIGSPIWIPMLLNNIGKYFKGLMEDKIEKIEGEIVSLEERDEPLFLFVFPSISSEGNIIPVSTYGTKPIHRYVLTVKKGIDLITVRLPLGLYQRLQNQKAKVKKHVSLLCQKNEFEINSYDFYERPFSKTGLIAT